MQGDVKVLVADDSATVRAAICVALTGRGHTVVEAEDGEQALALARAERPDVMLVDLDMPRLDGRAVLKALHADAELATTPVVFLTGRIDAAEMVASLEAGAHDYLHKPLNPAELVARVAAAARVKHLQDELRRRNVELDLLSRLDPLTGLFNRRHLEERLESLCSGSRRHLFPVSVAMVDIDHFKSVNDEHGHAAGDHVLRVVASTLKALVRTEDVPGRWGGEEFVLLLPYTEFPGTMAMAERTRDVVAHSPIRLPSGEDVTVTLSIGLSVGRGAEPAELVQRADAALYRAKAHGRNRVEADSEMAGDAPAGGR